jgi:hypothetical protein
MILQGAMIPSHRCAPTAGVRRMEKFRIAAALFLLLAGGIVRPAGAASARQRTVTTSAARAGVAQRGPLSDAERRRLQRLQRAERRLAQSLRLLRDQARQRHDAAAAAELERFLNALIAASEMRGEWSADAPYVRKAVPPQAWAAADETVQDLSVDADIGRVFTVDLGETPETPEATEATDTPDAAGAETGSVAEAVPVVEEVVVGPEDARDARDGEDMGTEEDAEAGPEATVPAVPVGAQQAAPAPAQTAPPAKPADPPAAPPIPPPIG